MNPLNKDQILSVLSQPRDDRRSPPFYGAAIGDFDFANHIFERSVDFTGAHFVGDANFEQVTFQKEALFSGAFFHKRARFLHARFDSAASFSNIQFRGDADFAYCRFADCAYFWRVRFHGKADFFQILVYPGKEVVAKNIFPGEANFSWSWFFDKARFTRAFFEGPAFFWRTLFASEVLFDEVFFKNKVLFSGTKTEVQFARSDFSNPEKLDVLEREGLLRPDLESYIVDSETGQKRPLFFLFNGISSEPQLMKKVNSLKSVQLSPQEITQLKDIWRNGAQEMFASPSSVSFRGIEFGNPGGAKFVDVNKTVPGVKIHSAIGQIHLAVVTIREDEYEAVLDRLPEKKRFQRKHRTYTVGTVSNRFSDSFQIAVVRTTDQGPNAAQDAARDIIEDLDPLWLTVVGICGAVSAPEFSLGDVVVATRLHDFTVGAHIERAIPEDVGQEGGTAEQTRYQYANQGGPMAKQVQDLVASLPSLKEDLKGWEEHESIRVARPPIDQSPKMFYGSKEHQEDVRRNLNTRFGSENTNHPIVTGGSIAASGNLIKSTITIQQWRQNARDLSVVEMELGGIYFAARRMEKEYPILAIRGISDVVGFKRDPAWTRYACNSAASFFFALLQNLPISHLIRQPIEGSE